MEKSLQPELQRVQRVSQGAGKGILAGKQAGLKRLNAERLVTHHTTHNGASPKFGSIVRSEYGRRTGC